MIALYKGTSFLSRLIRWFTWSPYSHAAWICRDGTVIEAWLPGGVQRVDSISINHRPGTQVDLFDIEGLTDAQRDSIEKDLADRLGAPYDLLGLLGFLTRERMETHRAYFCSELVFTALSVAGLIPLSRVPACQVSPGLLALSPRLVYKGTQYTSTRRYT